MRNNSSLEPIFKSLTAAFLVWSLLLVIAGATSRLTSFAWSIAWVEVGFVSVVTLVITVALVLVARQHYAALFPYSAVALGLGVAQILLGAAAIIRQNPVIISANLLTAMLLLGIAIFLVLVVHFPTEYPVQNRWAIPAAHRFYVRSILLTSAGFLLLFITGALVSGTQTGRACPDWPLCRGEIFPANFNLEIAINLLHRFTVIIVGALVAALVLQTHRLYRKQSQLKRWTTTLAVLYVAQAGLGGLYALVTAPQIISVFHLLLSVAIWAVLIILTTTCYCLLPTIQGGGIESAPSLQPSQPLHAKAKTFFRLTKPWIQLLLLITTITAMFIAAEGLPPLSLMLYTLLGGALSAGGASVLNSYIDSDIDGLMSRTSRRATVTGLVSPTETLVFGLTLSVLSFLVFALFVNMLSAILSTIGILYYVFFYTLYLKRRTIHNIIIGGAAGAIPPLVGWTAVTNSLDLGAFYLFAIIFFWTPPHTWALALLVKKDYAQARVPMLPVVVGEKETTYQIFLYTILLITLTLMPFTFNMLSLAYLITAIALGAPFIYLAWKLWRNFDKSVSKKLYKFSQAYLALLFLAMAIDRALF